MKRLTLTIKICMVIMLLLITISSKGQTGASQPSAIDMGIFSSSSGGSFYDSRNNTSFNGTTYTNNFGQPSPEVYYRFTVSGTTAMTFSLCGSNFDTYIHILNSSGGLIIPSDDSNECGTKSYLNYTMTSGTYYLVVEGYGAGTGTIDLVVSALLSSGSQGAPVISYSATNVFSVGSSVSLSPTNTGGAVTSGVIASTFAGTNSAGASNGPGSSATFQNPLGTATDASGNVYVADAGNNQIRKISPSGVVSTLAGSGDFGYLDGAGSSARFQHPSAVAVDVYGNVYVSDQQSHRIRKIDVNGYVTTFAGNGSPGSTNGYGTSASFNYPIGLAFTPSGSLLVCDSWNNKIRIINTAGLVSDYAGTGAQGSVNGFYTSATFNKPTGIAVSAEGIVYIADRYNHLVRKMVSGTVSTFAGSGSIGSSNGTGTAASFNYTNALAVDILGNVYVADQQNNMVRKITPGGVVSTFAGSTAAGTVNGTGSSIRFNSVYGLSIDGQSNLYIAENVPHNIRKVSDVKGYAISPALPAGLTLNETTGVISGTPTSVSPAATYIVTAYNGSGSHSFTMSISVVAVGAGSGSPGENYVVSYVPRKSGYSTGASVLADFNTNDVQTSYQYLDGLGRLSQTVHVKGNADGSKDLIQTYAYDPFNRQKTTYLPYTANGLAGSYRQDALSAQATFYNQTGQGYKDTQTPYAVAVYEASPLNRVVEQGSSGNAWQPITNSVTGHTNKVVYGRNSGTEVQLWTVNINGGASAYGNYLINNLHKTVTMDENWVSGKAGTVEEFKNLEGRVVLKRLWQTESISLSTYYVYDLQGNLRYVLSPGFNATSFSETDTAFLNYIYGYHYDWKGRLTEKKIPGKDWEYLVYNSLDQLVLSQNALQRVSRQWLFTKYDIFGRVVVTGLYTHPDASAQVAMQNVVTSNGVTNSLWETPVSTGLGYDNASFPQSISYYHSINYYDNYNFPGNLFGQPNLSIGQVTGTSVKGLLTASAITVLGTGHMLQTVNYYDANGRLVQFKSQHFKGGLVNAGNYDEVTNVYRFTGELASSERKHFVGTTQNLYVYNQYSYDNQGRRISTKQKTGDNSDTGNPLVILSKLEYNEVGQLKNKFLHATNLSSPVFAQTVGYTYNERGWMSSQTAPLFSQALKYNETISGAISQYNGNISRQEWGSGKYFNYSYDKLNRLQEAISNEGNNEVLTYDIMGNIQTLVRQHQTYGLVDQLSYNYTGTGNKLASISDPNANTNAMFQLPGTTNYVYDGNGNMTSRANSSYSNNNISDITYNFLNLPSTLNANGASITYTYDASGNKLKKVVTGSSILNNEYISGIHYEGGNLKFVASETGRVVRNSAIDYSYEYTLADHLGNGRVFFNVNSGGSAVKIQETDYYAFGLDIQRSVIGTENKYQYNGKEKQDQEKVLDYGARFYDPVIARWNTIDPLSELGRRWSPYTYTLNNPIRFIDPDGMLSTEVTENEDGTYTVAGGEADNDRNIYLVDKNGKRTGEIIGQSKTSHSFLDEKGNAVKGAVLDPKSSEGQNFFDKLEHDDPSLLSYMWGARNGKEYDFKATGIEDRGALSELQYKYRGSVDENGDYGSARDYGNMGAGLVAARSGLSWKEARFGFDTYQGYKSNGITIIPNKIGAHGPPIITITPVRETTGTVKAQMLGYVYGRQKYH